MCKSAKQVAAYFLQEHSRRGEQNDLTQLKLHKLLYYAQGLYLALCDRPLFPEEIRAWEHGPVLPTIYRDFPKGPKILEPYEDNGIWVAGLSVLEKSILDFTLLAYGRYDAWKLRDMTHREEPWKAAAAKRGAIQPDRMKDFFGIAIDDEDNFARQHSENNDELEEIADRLALLKCDADPHPEWIPYEEVKKMVSDG